MSGTQLVRYDAMCRAIAEAHAIDEVKDIRDKARAIELYARQAQNTEAEERARAIRLRAERKCGKMLTAQAESGERQMPGGNRRSSSDDPRMKLDDYGISYDQSSQWQKLAAVPEDLFEQALAEPNPSTTAIIMRHEVAERPAGLVMSNHQALWLWGCLQDFEREGILDEDPHELISSMLDHMQKTTLDLAPRVVAWLGRIGK
jgi:hypothetical protein